MYRVNFTLVLLAVLLNLNPAHSMFGQSDVPLIEYYEFGKQQTGVALVNTNDGAGTANLIDVGIESLRGRLLITCAHVLNNKLRDTGTVKFMDEANTSQTMDIQKFFCNPDFTKNKDMDIAFILLEKPVDILKFKPLKLNLTRPNHSLKGQQVDVFGCSPYFGKADCHMVFCDHDDYTLRRGMTTFFSDASDDSPVLQFHFYDHRGFVKILKRPSENDPRRIKIKEDIETLQKHRNSLDDHSDKRLDLLLKINGLRSELLKLSCYKLLEPLYYSDHFHEDLKQLKDTETLDKVEVMTQWEKLSKEDKSLSADFVLGDYHITMHRPLPRLSAQIYHGDSGGAWVHGDEIVAISSRRTCKGPDDLFTMDKKVDAMTSPEAYFADSEKGLADIKRLGMADPLIDETIAVSSAISIWSHREWIEKTLKEIVDQKL